MKHEIPDVELWFGKGKGTRDQIANVGWIIKNKQTNKKNKGIPEKNICFYFIDYTKAFDFVDQNKLENSERDGIPDHLTYILRNLYAGQEATVRIGHRTTDWFQVGKGVRQGCILSPWIFNLYAEYIMNNAGLDETWAGI